MRLQPTFVQAGSQIFSLQLKYTYKIRGIGNNE